MYSAPTQSLLQKWLREKYNIYVDAFFNANIINSTVVKIVKIEKEIIENEEIFVWKQVYLKSFSLNDNKYHFNIKEYKNEEKYKVQTYTYEQALEVGLQEELKLI